MRDGMVRRANVLMLCVWLVVLLSCAGACNTMKVWEQSGKTDTACSYFTMFLQGAQYGIPFFGVYAQSAQVVITTALGITQMLCQASDDYLEASLKDQVYQEVQKLNDLGSKAGIGSSK